MTDQNDTDQKPEREYPQIPTFAELLERFRKEGTVTLENFSTKKYPKKENPCT